MSRSLFRTIAAFAILGAALPLGLLAGGEPAFKEIRLAHDRNEGIALADLDRDGKEDLVAGGFWYRAPSWDRHPLRELQQDKEFAHNNGDLTLDVDGDGWIDVISGSWFDPEIYWYKNPGKEGLQKGDLWKRNYIGKMGSCEAKFLRDLDGDGLEDLVLDNWNDNDPVLAYRQTRGPDGPKWEEFKVGQKGCGHGMGFGDINGDGRADVIVMKGWYEVPADAFKNAPWTFHQEWSLGHTSTPVAVYDVNGDGLIDIVYGHGHDYQLRWLEQEKDEGGKRLWKDHAIDEKISQTHTITLADLDGDGKPEVITGKRLRGHGDGDPGSHDPIGLYYYRWDGKEKRFEKHVIREEPGIQNVDELQKRPAVGTGMKIIAHDFDGDGRIDLAVAGKSGTYVLMQLAPAAAGK